MICESSYNCIENISNEEFERVLYVNVKSVFLMSKEFVPQMKKRQSGVILNIASTAGISPSSKEELRNGRVR